MKKLLLFGSIGIFVLTLFLISSCNQSKKTKDRFQIPLSKENLSGIWLKKIEHPDATFYKGFDLMPDGQLVLENIYTMKGQNWELNGDTIILHSEMYKDSSSIASSYRVIQINEDTLRLKPLSSPFDMELVYKKSDVSIKTQDPEETLKVFIHFLNKADAVGVQSLMLVNRRYSIEKPMDITSYEILNKKVLTADEARDLNIKPNLVKGDMQMIVEQVISNLNTIKYTYYLREVRGDWKLLTWTYN